MEIGSIVKCIFDYSEEALKYPTIVFPNMIDEYTIEFIGEMQNMENGQKGMGLQLVELIQTDEENDVAFDINHFVELLPPMDVAKIYEEAFKEELVNYLKNCFKPKELIV